MAQQSWKYAQGPYRVDYEHRTDPHALREARIARAREQMRAAGVDALLLWKNENVRYLTGLRAQLIAGKSTVLNGCLLTLDGAPVLLASGGEIQRCRHAMPWIEEMHAVPIMEAAGLVRGTVDTVIAPLLQRRGLATGIVGLDAAGTSLFHALQALLPAVTIADGDAPMLAARRTKLPGE